MTAADTLFENVVWLLHDLMDDIREEELNGNLGAASDLAYEARRLFLAFPDQPDPRTYAEKTRDELRKRGHLDSAP